MNLSQQLRSTPVIVRFCLRLIILVVFAAFAGIGFGKSFAALLWMSVILSAVVGAIKREPAFGADLNYWDETIAYAALFALVSNFNHAVPV
jgi:uncharacterized membrane protein YcaP (DUF421 family)